MAENNANDTMEITEQAVAVNAMVDKMAELLNQDE